MDLCVSRNVREGEDPEDTPGGSGEVVLALSQISRAPSTEKKGKGTANRLILDKIAFVVLRHVCGRCYDRQSSWRSERRVNQKSELDGEVDGSIGFEDVGRERGREG